jgi:hypothetical protein
MSLKENLISTLLLALLSVTQAAALPNFSGKENDRDISYNIFRLNSNLRTSSILKYAKCADLEDNYSTKDLLSSAIKLDCNSHKTTKSFCECVGKIAGDKISIKDITKRYDQEYREYLQEESPLLQQIKLSNLTKEYITLRQFHIRNNKPTVCSSDAETDYLKLEKDLDTATKNMTQEDLYLDFSSNNQSINPVHENYFLYESLRKDNNNYNKTVDFLKKFYDKHPKKVQQYRDLDLIVDEEEIIAVTNLHSALRKELNNHHIIDESIFYNTHEFFEQIISIISKKKGLTKEIPKVLVEDALNEHIDEMCKDFDQEYMDAIEGNIPLSRKIVAQVDEQIDSIISLKDDQRKDEYNFKSFIENKYPENSSEENINERFEGDIYYCHKAKQFNKAEHTINLSIEDAKDLEELNRLAIKIIENDKRLKELNQKEENERKNITYQEHMIKSINKSIQRNNEVIESYKNSENVLWKKKAEMLKQTNIKLENRLKNRNKEILRSKYTLSLINKEKTNLLAQETQTKEEIKTVLKGSKDAANLFVSKARDSARDESIFSYDNKTKRMKFNKSRVPTNKKGLNSFANFEKNSKKLEKKGIQTLSTLQRKHKKKKYFSNKMVSDKDATEVSNLITSIDPKDLSKKQRRVQSQLKSVDQYEEALNNRIKHLENKKLYNNNMPPSSVNSKELTKLRNEIASLTQETKDLKLEQNKSKTNTATSINSKEDYTNTSSKISSLEKNAISEKTRENIGSKQSTTTKNLLPNEPSTLATNNQPSVPDSISQVEPVVENETRQRSEYSNDKSKAALNSSNLINDISLSEDEFSGLSSSLDLKLLKEYQISKGEYFTVKTKDGEIIYSPIIENGKLVGFQKIKEVSTKEVISAHKKEIQDVKKVRKSLIQHQNLVNLFSDIIEN